MVSKFFIKKLILKILSKILLVPACPGYVSQQPAKMLLQKSKLVVSKCFISFFCRTEISFVFQTGQQESAASD